MKLETKLNELLPQWKAFDITFHELWREAEGGWSVNDSWTPYRNRPREEAIGHLRHRWEVFKLNYLPKARVKDIVDIGDDYSGECRLEVDCTAFATLRESETVNA